MASALYLLSDDEVDKIAAFDITGSGDLHDPRFGNAGSTEVECRVCGMRGDECMGHHASLSLGVSIFHPLMYKESERLINSVCFGCKKELKRVSKSKSRRCTDCNIVNHGDYTIYRADMSVAVRPDKNEFKHANSIPKGVLPDGYIISRVLVPPIHLRTPEGMEWSGDLQKLYVHLVETVRKRGSAQDVSSAYHMLVGAKKNEGIIGLMSGKSGVFRKFMLGKRVEFSARAVVVGDPGLELDEVAVPKSAQSVIRVKVNCNRYNIGLLKEVADKGFLWWEGTNDNVMPHNILFGMVFERQLMNGDYVMLNRQPSLSRHSMTCFKVVVRKDAYNVFGINPQSTPPFNADFDGDEMNVFFMSHTCPPECRAELMELCHVKNHVPVQDVVTGCYMMSANNTPVGTDAWSDCATICEAWYRPDWPVPKTTHGLLSMCIPGYRGEVLTKGTIYRESVDLYKLQLVVERWLSKRGLTVSYSSVNIAPLSRRPDESADAYRERCITKVRKELAGTGLMDMIDSGAKGSVTHAAHMAVAIGQQYICGREGVFCNDPYSRGLRPEEFFGHQMAAREGVVSTGVSTANTGYLNRRACKIMADVKLQYNGVVADNVMVSSFSM
jgi:DNA-directed RNA polymerase beta' subunit